MQKLRSQLEQLQTELLFSRSGSAALEELQVGFADLQGLVEFIDLLSNFVYASFSCCNKKCLYLS
jgi:hypothetical protein